MQKHLETSLSPKDIHKKVEHWAANHDFNETDSDISKETLKVLLSKDYGTSVRFRWGLCIGLFFLGALLTGILGGSQPGSAGGNTLALLALAFPLGYVAYYFYSKSGGMKVQVSVTASSADGKTEVQIKSEADTDELKSDMVKLYNSLAE